MQKYEVTGTARGTVEVDWEDADVESIQRA